MRRRKSSVFALVLISLMALVAIDGRTQEKSDGQAVTATRLRKLQQERVSVLSKAAELATAAYREGMTSFKVANTAQQQLLVAQLELAEKRGERIKLLSAQVEHATAGVKFSQAKFEAGQSTMLEVLQAKAALLEIKIKLAKVELSPAENTESKAD